MKIIPILVILMTAPIFAQVATPNATATVTLTAPLPVAAKSAITPATANVTTGTPVIFTVTLSGTGAVPTGTVQLYDGKTLIAGAVGALVNGAATCTLTTVGAAVGAHNITAVYSGNSVYAGGLVP